MAVTVPQDGAEVHCTLIGAATDVEVLVARDGDVVTVSYSRPTASQQRRVHLVVEHRVDDHELVLELSRLQAQ